MLLILQDLYLAHCHNLHALIPTLTQIDWDTGCDPTLMLFHEASAAGLREEDLSVFVA